jgi:hypothetical protein
VAQEQEQSARAQEATAFVNAQLEEIKSEHTGLTDEDIDSICTLATKYVPNDGSAPLMTSSSRVTKTSSGLWDRLSESYSRLRKLSRIRQCMVVEVLQHLRL